MHLHPHSIRSGKSVREQFERVTGDQPWEDAPRTLSIRDLLKCLLVFGIPSIAIVAGFYVGSPQ